MKPFVLALALLFMLPSAADAKCFLLIFCSAPRHARTPDVKPANAFCAGIKRAYEKSPSSRGEFSLAFPERDRVKVAECLK